MENLGKTQKNAFKHSTYFLMDRKVLHESFK